MKKEIEELKKELYHRARFDTYGNKELEKYMDIELEVMLKTWEKAQEQRQKDFDDLEKFINDLRGTTSQLRRRKQILEEIKKIRDKK